MRFELKGLVVICQLAISASAGIFADYRLAWSQIPRGLRSSQLGKCRCEVGRRNLEARRWQFSHPRLRPKRSGRQTGRSDIKALSDQ